MNSDPYAFHAVVLAYGATREELAADLEAKAASIRDGEGDMVTEGPDGVLIIRQSNGKRPED